MMAAQAPQALAVVESVRALPYARPRERSVEGMLREGRGTCSTKHLYLLREFATRWPDTRPRLVHRVYALSVARARELFGEQVAAALPPQGVTDVHRYLEITLDGKTVTIDATFPGGVPWDGRSSMPLACGEGQDFPAGDDPDADKRELEARYCDQRVREAFIAALAASGPAKVGGGDSSPPPG